MKIEIIGRGPITPAQLDEILSGTFTTNESITPAQLDEILSGAFTTNKRVSLEKAMDKLIDEVKYDDEKARKDPICFDIQTITANHKKNAFTVVWGDGSHTIIHLQPGDVWDDEKALAMCFVKHLMDDTGSFNDIFTTEMPAKIKHIGNMPQPVEHNTKAPEKPDSASTESTEAPVNTHESLKKVVKQLADDQISEPTYEVYLSTPVSQKILIVSNVTKQSIAKALRQYIKYKYPSCISTPWRLWNHYDGMYIDFGSSSYFLIPGMTTEEWLK